MPHPSIALPLLLAALTASVPTDVEGQQVSLTGRVVIRVEPVRMPRPVRWVEKKGPKCIDVDKLSGAIVNGTDSVDLMLKGKTLIRAHFNDDCQALGYYGGFYLKTASDGKVCARRDEIRTRTGDACSISAFKRLVAKR